MRIPRTLASGDATHRIVDDRGKCFATVALFDPLEAEQAHLAAVAFAGRADSEGFLVIRSGSWTSDDSGSLAWLPKSREQFSGVCDAFENTLISNAPNAKPALWPHAGGVVSDAPSLQTFLRTRQRLEWSFIFDPAAMITPAMAATAQHHFDRLFAQLGEHPRACALVEDPVWTPQWPKGWDRLPLVRLVRESAAAAE
jgi:hypothetical protein